MTPAAQSSIPRLVRTTALLRGIITKKKAPNIKANTFFFFSKGKRIAHVICVTAHTKSVRSFQFLCESGSTIWGLSSFFSLAMFSTVDGSVRLVIAIAKFGLLQKMWALLIKHEDGWACGTEYAGFQGLESQAARVNNCTMLKASSTGCLWRMAILGSLNEWYNKIFSKNLVLVFGLRNEMNQSREIRSFALNKEAKFLS